jgi:nitrate/nitrite transport system permease protein
MTVSDAGTGTPYYGGEKESLFFTEGVRAVLLFVGSLVAFLLFWEFGARTDLFTKGMPTATETLKELWWWVTNPFFNNGPNDLGIGWNLLISLRRVAIGYFLASLVAVPLGILMGISSVARKGFNPYVQLLKPISPLAWLPLGLYIFRDSEVTGCFHHLYLQHLADVDQYRLRRRQCR